MQLNRKYATLAPVVLCAGLLTVNLLSQTKAAHAAPAALSVPSPVQLSNSFKGIAKEAEPSVVQITSTIQQKASPNMRWFFNGQPQEGNPFGDMSPFGGQNPFGGDAQPRRAMGLGS